VCSAHRLPATVNGAPRSWSAMPKPSSRPRRRIQARVRLHNRFRLTPGARVLDLPSDGLLLVGNTVLLRALAGVDCGNQHVSTMVRSVLY
jgi:hypothetical protein